MSMPQNPEGWTNQMLNDAAMRLCQAYGIHPHTPVLDPTGSGVLAAYQVYRRMLVLQLLAQQALDASAKAHEQAF